MDSNNNVTAPSSSAFPIQTFQQSAFGATPAALLKFLRGLVDEHLSDTQQLLGDKEEWITVITGLCDSMLSSFPSLAGGSWDVLHEKVTLVDITLEVIHRVIARLEGFTFNADKVVLRLLNLCSALDIRRDPDVQDQDVPSPKQLRAKALSVTIQTLRYLGNTICSTTGADTPPWEAMKRILTECIQSGQELSAQDAILNFPILFSLSSSPRIQAFETLELYEKMRNEGFSSPCLDGYADVADLLCLWSDILAGTFSPPLRSQAFLRDIIPQATSLMHEVFNSLLLARWEMPLEQRLQAVSRIVSATIDLQTVSEFASLKTVCGDMIFRLVLLRIETKALGVRVLMDDILSKGLNPSLAIVCAKTNALTIIKALPIDVEDDLTCLTSIVSYITLALPKLDITTVEHMKDIVSQSHLRESAPMLVNVIDRHLASQKPPDLEKMEVDEQAPVVNTWQTEIHSSVQSILTFAGIIEELDNNVRGEDHVQWVLRSIKDGLARATDISTESQASMLKALRDMSCLLSHPGEPKCRRVSGLDDSLLIAYSTIVDSFVADDGTVIPALRKLRYEVFESAIKHCSLECRSPQLDKLSDLLRQGISEQNRSVRLSAGRGLVELIRLYHAIGKPSWTKVERIFDTFYGLLDTSKEPVKESVLLTVTAVGKATDTQILSVAISCLISQIGHPNPVLKGTAYMQLLSLAKHHKKSPYGLALPYMDKIAPFLIQRWHSQPAMLMEACRFFKMSTSDFISYHLPRTLPGLFASCDLKVLEKIAKDLETQPSLLFLRHSEDVLAHVYLLSTPAKTTQALTFIVNVVADATGGGTVDITNLLRSCIVPLLAKLVNVLGEEDENRVQAATQALHKVEASLSTRSGGRRKQPPPDLATFLKTHMLGVISHLIDMLQDIQGKKTTESKRQILRSLGALTQILGPSISSVAPQIMATLQMMLGVPELSDVTLEIWYTFLTTLSVQELGPQVGPTSASLVGSWSSLSTTGREITRKIFLYFLVEVGGALSNHLDDIVDPAGIPELADAHKKLWNLRNGWKEADKLRRILDRAANDNVNVSLQAFRELKIMMAQHRDFFQGLASGDNFHPTVSRLLEVILTAACRDLDGSEDLRLLAYECLGALGAVDPDRCDYDLHDTRMVVLKNFTDEGESVMFALHLITEVLVGAFRSTSDITYQTNLAYAIQELLRFCQFTPALVSHNSNSSIPLRVRNRWSHLPKHVLETVTPLLEARFSARDRPAPVLELPIYPKQSTYREWIQLWTTHLISRVQGETARTIFLVFRSAVRNKDVGVAHHLLPHLVLTTLVSGQEEDAMNVRAELLAVLQDQVDPDSQSTPDKKLLSAQAVFMLLDHLNKWVRLVRQEMNGKKAETKRSRSHAGFSDIEEQLMRVDSVLSNIDQDLMAKAAFKCKAYARALMSFERHIGTLQDRNAGNAEIQQCYERLHEIYANLDEPDGMEGVSTLILAPTLEHQIRQHESTGRWTSAQSCWELRLQQSPDNLDYHIGLLRCLRNLGHYDTLRTHVKGVLTRNPAWKTALAGFQVESAWMIGDWGEVESLVTDTESQTSSMVVARLLLALRADDSTNLEQALSQARLVLGNPISTAGPREYRHSYEAVLNLHQVHEVEMVYEFMRNLPTSGTNSARQRSESLAHLSHDLTARLELTLPTFRVREPILSMRRTAFGLNAKRYHPLAGEIGRSWLTSARIARKAGHSQTAYSAMLQAEQSRTPFSFIQSARLIKANGEPLRALQALKNSIELCGLGSDTPGDVIDLTEDDEETKQMKAKAEVLHARWMNDSERFDSAVVLKAFQRATELWPKWETATYYLGKFQDECYKNLPAKDQKHRGMRMNVSTVRCFAKSMRNGSKYIYQTVPRMLTIWLDMGEDRTNSKAEMFNKVNAEVARTIQIVPPYMWYMTFPQIVSRIGHSNPVVYEIMADLISAVLREYPQQGLWLFASVMKSTKPLRETRAREILTKLRNNPMNSNTLVPRLIDEIMAMANALLGLCDFPVKDNSKKTLSMKKDFPEFAKLVPSKLIIPLQESLIVTLPPTSASTEPEHQHQPFPIDTPTFHRFLDEIDVMHSLARPRKITIVGNNNQTYMFLGKPKDDLRKDARLMDFYAIINKLLKANSDSRRRQLHIRTYGVVTLNEECGFIQWVPNTIPIRPVLLKYYEARGIRSWYSELNAIFSRIKEATDKDGCRIFVSEVLPLFPPVFHEWFIETFPEPTAWLASRLTYGRTAAVMSMVGFILGLGDRHGENILLDENSGDAIHVDFNCLFEKGKTLETPERVPFRLTQNMVDGLGVTGVEGVFRNACELTLQMLRDNKDILMSVLDAFIHDPLVEWEDEKRKLEREAMRRATNSVKQSVDLRMLAKNALQPIEKKLKGIYSTNKERSEKEFSTTNLVQALIQEATDNQNLGKMYPGWAAFH